MKIEHYKLLLVKFWQWAFFTTQIHTFLFLLSFLCLLPLASPTQFRGKYIPHFVPWIKSSIHFGCLGFSFRMSPFSLWALLNKFSQMFFPEIEFWGYSYNHKMFSPITRLTIPWIQMIWKILECKIGTITLGKSLAGSASWVSDLCGHRGFRRALHLF